jgi:hypothetical protein
MDPTATPPVGCGARLGRAALWPGVYMLARFDADTVIIVSAAVRPERAVLRRVVIRVFR